MKIMWYVKTNKNKKHLESSSIRKLMETIFRGFQKWVVIRMFLFTKNMVSGHVLWVWGFLVLTFEYCNTDCFRE